MNRTPQLSPTEEERKRAELKRKEQEEQRTRVAESVVSVDVPDTSVSSSPCDVSSSVDCSGSF